MRGKRQKVRGGKNVSVVTSVKEEKGYKLRNYSVEGKNAVPGKEFEAWGGVNGISASWGLLVSFMLPGEQS